MLTIRTNYASWHIAKYVAREVLFSFLMGTTIFLLIMLMFQAIRLSDFIVVHQVPLKEVGKLSAYLMLTFLPIAVPIAFLFAVLMGISRANSEGEIVGMQVSGIGLGQLYAPLAFFSLFVTAFCLYTSLYAVPKGNRAFELLIEKLGAERVMSALKPGTFLGGFYGMMIYAEQISNSRSEMKRVFIMDERDEKMPVYITAQSGILRSDPEKSRITLRLGNGTIHMDRKDSDRVQQKIDFKVYDINLTTEKPGDIWRSYSLPSYNLDQLIAVREQARNVHEPTFRAVIVEIHRRISLSFSCVVFSALGFFIATLSHRGMRSTSIILCMLVATIYWLSYLVAHTLATTTWPAAWIGIWFPNLIFLGVAYLCYRRYRRGP